ncbi:MAG TPA: nucleotidyltransferase domain-containing protein [Firmicutes bacterium]|nr:nucleotidyltransferase domain-containing protein [Bacillota bacterium]
MGHSIGHFARKREEYRRLLEESVKKAVSAICDLQGVVRISLVGSLARGRADLCSDIDLVVVMCTQMPFIERLRLIYGSLCLPVDVDVLCYTPEEFEELREKPFLKNLLRGEVVLYEKNSC